MIIELFFNLIFTALNYVVSIFPAFTLPTEFVSAWGTFGGYVSAVGFILPMTTVKACLSLIALFYAVEFLFAVSNYFFRKVPTIS